MRLPRTRASSPATATILAAFAFGAVTPLAAQQPAVAPPSQGSPAWERRRTRASTFMPASG